MCCEGKNEVLSPAGRLTTCLLHVGWTSDWHGFKGRWNEVQDKSEGCEVWQTGVQGQSEVARTRWTGVRIGSKRVKLKD